MDPVKKMKRMELENRLIKLKNSTSLINLAKKEGYFTTNQEQRWESLLAKVPDHNRVYI